MNSKTVPVMMYLSNLFAFLGIALGYWFANVGMGFGRGSSVNGDAIFGGMLLIGGLILSLAFLLIGLVRREGSWLYYVFPVIAIIAFSVHFYMIDKKISASMERTKRYNSITEKSEEG